MMMRHPLHAHAILHPHEIAASDGKQVMTWQALSDAFRSACERIAASGVHSGDIAVVAMLPSLAALPWIHALPAMGVVPLFLNPLSSRAELEDIARRFPVSYLIGDAAERWGNVFFSAGRFTGGEKDRGGGAPPTGVPIRTSGGHHRGGGAPPTVLILTSGTGGAPKAARLSIRSFRAHAEASRKHLSLTSDDCWLAAMPIHHVGGLSVLMRAATLGCRVEIREKFDAAEVNRLLDDGTVSHLSVVPTTLGRLLTARDGKPFPPTVKLILTGGAALPTDIAAAARALAAPVAPTYGLTEACSQVATMLPQDFLAGETGATPLPGVEISIRKAEGLADNDSGDGEIWLRSPFLMDGYFGAGSALDAEGWFATGDIGRMANGRLQILDRRTDLIVSGGENISPLEVERCIRILDGVTDCAVIGLPDPAWGARLTAVIAGNSPDAASVLAHCRSRLSPHKVPKDVVYVEHIPRTAVGKIQHQVLRDRFASRHGSMRQF